MTIPPELLAAHAAARAAHLAATVPSEVPAWRLHAVASRTPHGNATLAEAIDAAIASLPEPVRTNVHASWHRGTVVRRDSPTVQQLATGLGIAPAALDSLFRQAATIAV